MQDDPKKMSEEEKEKYLQEIRNNKPQEETKNFKVPSSD
jgi:hypothetical protein